jgi:hypothetical protein
MWAAQRPLWSLIYQISSDNSYDSMTKVIDTHYKYYPPYMIRLTITVPLQPRTPFFMWKILLLELSAYTITYICAPHTCEFTHQPHPLIHAPVTDRMHLLTCTNHTYQVVYSPAQISTNQSMWQNGGLRSVDKVANELWALIFSQGYRFLCSVCVIAASTTRWCVLNNTELRSIVSFEIFFHSKGMDYKIRPWETKINMNYI